jgi:peptide/nickel transport system substrate-binding protein
LEQALSLQETDPDLLYETYASPGTLLQLRCDREPFTDIRVRKALQLAINLPELAETYYKGTVDWEPVGVINPAYTGFATPYDDWPQELKDEYAYNPEKAKQLLADAGYPNGFDTDVLAAEGGPGGDLQLLQVLQSYFKAINVNMEINAQPDFWAVMQLIMAKKHDQMVAMGLSDDTPPQMGMRFYIAAEPTNGLCQNDPTWEALVEAVTNATDKAATQAACVEANDYWLRQHWVVTTFPLNKYVFWQPYLKGYSGEKADSWSFSALGLPRFWISK